MIRLGEFPADKPAARQLRLGGAQAGVPGGEAGLGRDVAGGGVNGVPLGRHRPQVVGAEPAEAEGFQKIGHGKLGPLVYPGVVAGENQQVGPRHHPEQLLAGILGGDIHPRGGGVPAFAHQDFVARHRLLVALDREGLAGHFLQVGRQVVGRRRHVGAGVLRHDDGGFDLPLLNQAEVPLLQGVHRVVNVRRAGGAGNHRGVRHPAGDGSPTGCRPDRYPPGRWIPSSWRIQRARWSACSRADSPSPRRNRCSRGSGRDGSRPGRPPAGRPQRRRSASGCVRIST